MLRVRPVEEEDLALLRELFEEYALSLGFPLGFQHFDEELASLPGDYASPRGCALIAEDGGAPVGCIAVRPLGETVCEMKRLYVRPSDRGKGAGRLLAEEAVSWARRAGYAAMRLDTIDNMTAAIALYRSLGFAETEPYRHNPVDGAVYFELSLLAEDSSSVWGESD